MVVDTMVFAYALLGVQAFRHDATKILEHADFIIVPDSFRAEMANVLWQWTKHRNVAVETALQIMDDAESMIDKTLPGADLWERSLVISAESNHPAYDTFFVAAAELENTWVVSFDKKMKSVFPDKVMTAREFLSARDSAGK